MALLRRRHAVLLSAATTLRRGGGTAMTGAGLRCLGARGSAGSGSARTSSASSTCHHSRSSYGGASFVSTPLGPLAYSPRLQPRPLGARYSAGRSSPPRRLQSTRRHLSSGSDGVEASTTISLPNKTGDRNGLIRHEILADDGHPLRLYSRAPRQSHTNGEGRSDGLLAAGQRSILLLHGRTWSSQPVFDLRTSDDDDKRQSTLQSLSDLGFHAYALDLRGFGETPRDGGGYTTPDRCVADVKCAIDWMTDRHGVPSNREDEEANGASIPGFEDPTVISTRPALLGWSQGALVAQMYAQRHGPSTLSDLILFGSIFDPKVIYPRKPLYDPSGRLVSGAGSEAFKPPAPEVQNTDLASLEDFTLPGTICDEAALTFSSLALQVDPIKAAWDELHEFNVCNPALVHVPTLVIVGAQDPYVSWEAQRELFERLGTEDRAMCVLPGCDHAAHILKARKMFVRGVAGFLLRKDVF